MLAKPQPPRILLPKGSQGCVKLAVLDAIALAHYAIVSARAQAAESHQVLLDSPYSSFACNALTVAWSAARSPLILCSSL